MSMDYFFCQADIDIFFDSKEDMEKRIKDFNNLVAQHDSSEEESEGGYYKAYIPNDELLAKQLRARLLIDTDVDDYIDIDGLANLICKCFPKSTGHIGWAQAEVSAGGYTRYADGGRVYIAKGEKL